jgi:epoxyqueuosine reductase QueG
MAEKNNYNKLKEFALNAGASLFGVCELKPEQEEIFLPRETLKGLNRAVSMAVRLSDDILDGIIDKPTRLYFHHYRSVNMFLDQLAITVQQFIQKEGFRALPIPASQILDWEKQLGHLSHKRFAELAGIGWLGRNNLIVSPKHGAKIRLATILTDMPLDVDKPLNDSCGECKKCISVCPAASIKDNKKEFDYDSCYEKLKEFRKNRYVDQFICGVCVKACDGKKAK